MRVVLRLSSCAPTRALSVLPLLPVLVSGMDGTMLPAAGTGAISTLSVAASVAWYLAGTSASSSAVKAVSVLVDVAVQGVEEVVGEVIEGSKMVIRCLSIGIMITAALAIVRVGWWSLAALIRRTTRTPRSLAP